MNNLDNGVQSLSIDPEQIKSIVRIMKLKLIEMENAKKKADVAWDKCKSSLGENISKSIDAKKIDEDKKFNLAKEQLDNYTNRLNSVSNIWNDTETEIMASSKEFEDKISKASNSINEALGFNMINQVKINNKKESSDI